MSNFTAIRAVTDTLAKLIEQQLSIPTEKKVSPHVITATTPLVSVFLYRVEPNPFLSNLDWQAPDDTTLIAPPIALNLHYLLTPYGADLSEVQKILGEVLRAFHETPIIRPGHPALSADLATMTEELRILPHKLPFADLLELWKSFNNNVPYRLSVTYEVSTVIIDSRITRNVTRVRDRVVEVSRLR